MKTGFVSSLDSPTRSYEEMRVTALDFLETDVFNISPENCVTFLDPLIESWDIDFATFAMEIVLNRSPRARAPEKIRVRGTAPRPTGQRRAGAPGLPAGSISEGRCDRGGNRVSQEAEIHAKPANPALLLPRAAKPARPAPFSPRPRRCGSW